MSFQRNVPHGHLPRLSEEAYGGLAFVHWTMAIKDREIGWLDLPWFECMCHEALRLCFRYDVALPAWVAMPDHLHFLVVGTSPGSNQRLFVRALRRMLNGSFPANIQLQKQAYDHVLRPNERGTNAFSALVYYISRNPVRSGLASQASEWPYTTSIVPGIENLSPTDPDFSNRWWAWWNRQVAT